jgi:histidinol-phosphate aminotransferase
MRVEEAVGRVRNCIRRMQGYVPGKQPGDNVRYIKLNTNENPYPPSPLVLAALHETINDDLRLYPDPSSLKLRQAAARLYGCQADEVIAGNGSDDILTIVFRTFLDPGDAIATPAPSYSLYNVLSSLQYALPEDLHRYGAKVTIIVNPNAPTGVLFERDAICNFLTQTQGIVVIDEAYADFADETAIDLIKTFPNLIVVRTFSKSYALCGVRLGLGFAHRDMIAQMMKVKDAYNLDRLAIAAGCAALQDQDWLRETTAKIIRTRTHMLRALTDMGLHVPASRTNFVFPRIPGGRAPEIHAALENRHILVRYFKGAMTANNLRVTVGTDEEVALFLQALRELL